MTPSEMFYRMEAVQSTKEIHGSTFECALLRHQQRRVQPTLNISKLLCFTETVRTLKRDCLVVNQKTDF